jgi:hypothetical protein
MMTFVRDQEKAVTFIWRDTDWNAKNDLVNITELDLRDEV